MNLDQLRLEEARNTDTPWKKWAPYLSERQWGPVREDYGADEVEKPKGGRRQTTLVVETRQL